MTDEQIVTSYWRLVRACLVELYGRTEEAASEEVRALWSRMSHRSLAAAAAPSLRSLIYHDQPIHIAIGLVGDRIPSEAVWDGYQRLLKRHGFSHGAIEAKAVPKTEKAKPAGRAKHDVAEQVFAGR